ncbi:hypothetical protein RI129_001499 [Pyrocoelia pectoralis]|uniref:Uncharacterized protein n=1 Tax=Pyrocoelia pectoralis TaxID=417401 RepID=A0AAN7VJP5_9COLE
MRQLLYDSDYEPDEDENSDSGDASAESDNEADDLGIIPMDEEIDENERAQIVGIIANWQDDNAGMKTLNFSETNQMLVNLPDDPHPYNYFRLLVDAELLHIILEETNHYAIDFFNKTWA